MEWKCWQFTVGSIRSGLLTAVALKQDRIVYIICIASHAYIYFITMFSSLHKKKPSTTKKKTIVYIGMFKIYHRY